MPVSLASGWNWSTAQAVYQVLDKGHPFDNLILPLLPRSIICDGRSSTEIKQNARRSCGSRQRPADGKRDGSGEAHGHRGGSQEV
jgi:hypothetical protein